MRRLAGMILVSALLQACGGSSGVPVANAPASSQAVAFHIDAAHTGLTGILAPVFPASAAWTKSFIGPVSYPLIAGGKVFVIEFGTFANSNATHLHALDRSTGATAWGSVLLPGLTSGGGHAFDNGKLFVTTFEGLVLSFDAATGQPGWSTKLPDTLGFVAAPTANGGIVYVSSGGRVFALDESNGAIVWSAPVNGGGFGTPSVAGGRVIVAYPCQYYALSTLSGAELWHYGGGCSGGGGSTVSVSGEIAYVRDIDNGSTFGPLIDIRASATGVSGGRYASPGLFSQEPIPSVTADAVFLLEGGTLRRHDRALTQTTWSFAGDGTLTSAPLILDTAIVVAATSGQLYAVDAATGRQIWSARLPSGIDSGNDAGTLTLVDLAAGEGYLVVPARTTLTAFHVTP